MARPGRKTNDELTKRRRLIEDAPIASEELFRPILENIDDLVAVIDLKGNRIYNSPSYAKILGDTYSLQGTDSMKEIHPDDRERIRQVFQETVRTGVGRRSEYRFVLPDGSVRHIESQGSVIRDTAGAVSKVLVVSRDVTERKHAEEERATLQEQLRRAQKLESIGVLAGGIAHDFNNILAIILGYISMLSRQKPGAEEQARVIDTINQTISRGATLVRQLLTFAKTSEVLFEPLNLNMVVEELTKVIPETFPKTISLVLETSTELPSIFADAGQIHQALLNLCVNARDAMPDGGTLTIKTGPVPGKSLQNRFTGVDPGHYVVVHVSDTGTGIEDTARGHIFEPFFTTKGKGSGLGLAVVYGIVRSHHGFIDLESVPGQGTTFNLYFPVYEKKSAPEKVEQEHHKEIPGGDETILIVEDEQVQRDLVRMLLEGKGYNVLSASDGAEAVEVYRKNMDKIALVVSDMGLPKQTGLEAFLRMKEINPKANVIFATGYLEADLKNRILEEGARDIVQKPYVPNEILRKIRDVIDAGQNF